MTFLPDLRAKIEEGSFPVSGQRAMHFHTVQGVWIFGEAVAEVGVEKKSAAQRAAIKARIGERRGIVQSSFD